MTTRRQFLAGVGGAALAAPFARLLTPTARADASMARRLLVFFTPNGTVPDRLWPTGSGTGFSIPENSAFAPLASIQDKVTILKGLNFFNAANHEPGMKAMLTNNGTAGHVGQGMSLDQFIASEMGGGSRFRSMELGVQTSAWGGSTQTRMSYLGPGQFATPDDNPLNVYQRMYGDLLGGPEEAAKLRARRGSVLDVIADELADLHSRVGVEERRKLDAHLAAVSAMEHSLDEVISCTPDVAPSFPGGVYANDNFPLIGASQVDLAIAALTCGMTQVVSLQWAHTVSPVVFSWLGLSEGHHSLSHVGDSDLAGVDKFIAAEQWFAAQFVDIVERLDALEDPETGGTMLDSTVVLWCQEMGDGRMHVCEDVPFVIAGAPQCFTPGRFLDLTPRHHSGLLVSVANAFGLNVDTFGDPASGTGGIQELS